MLFLLGQYPIWERDNTRPRRSTSTERDFVICSCPKVASHPVGDRMEDRGRYDWEPSVRKFGETEMLPETTW